MIYWIYAMPIWLFGLISISVFCTFGIAGLAATRRWAPSLHHATVSYNDIVGYYFGAITVLYGIALGLLMVGVWCTFTGTQEKVDREASTLAAFYIDVSHYPEPNRGRLQDNLRGYTREVIDVAWPQQRKGVMPKGNISIVANLANELAAFEPASEEQKILHTETYDKFNQLVERRRSRVVGPDGGPFWSLVVARFDRRGDEHRRDVVPSPAKPKNALLDDGLDLGVARADDFPPRGNGSSEFRGDIGVFGTF